MRSSRRAFLAALASAAAMHALPRQLLAANPPHTQVPKPPADEYTEKLRAGELWAALYELDSRMSAMVHYRRHTLHVWTRADRDLVEDALWRHVPIGVLCYYNDQPVSFSERHLRAAQGA